jgi:hypothetical protein
MREETRDMKIESMGMAYPSLRVVSEPDSALIVWEGTIQPIRYSDELDAILDDLEQDREVFIINGKDHEIRHHPNCELSHGTHRLASQIENLTRSFVVRVTDFNDGRLPQTEILEPLIPDELRVHFFADGICAFAPWKYPRDEAIVTFVDHSLIWLFKWTVYAETHVWIGDETDHRPEYLLRTLRSADPCFCGSANDFEHCCRSLVGYAVYGKAWIALEAWLQRHNANLRRFENLVTPVQEPLRKYTVKANGR